MSISDKSIALLNTVTFTASWIVSSPMSDLVGYMDPLFSVLPSLFTITITPLLLFFNSSSYSVSYLPVSK